VRAEPHEEQSEVLRHRRIVADRNSCDSQ
jgi:hypothetical protein